jgi:purine-nucleoside phosphorylase
MLDKRYTEPSVFTPENLLREARRQKSIAVGEVPRVCILDPDGDVVEHLGETGRLSVSPHWACYHTVLNKFTHEGVCFGIVGCAVGSSFAVLVAEQLFASGCELLISVTSAGIVARRPPDAPFMLITSALRDEGTSVHYAPANKFSRLDDRLEALLSPVLREVGVTSGASWTTDAPYRETASAIEQARSLGITCVEMEAAALYAFAQAREKQVVCLAHLTNTMAQDEDDFEKGEANGSLEALRIIAKTAATMRAASSG